MYSNTLEITCITFKFARLPDSVEMNICNRQIYSATFNLDCICLFVTSANIMGF